MDGKHQDVFISGKYLNQENVIKSAENGRQAIETAVGMISAKACLVTFLFLDPKWIVKRLLIRTKLYKMCRKSEYLSKISIGACTSLAFALQSQNFIKNI